MTQIPTDLSRLHGLGSVVQFDVDIANQTVTVGVSAIASEGDDWHRLTATFGKVIAFDFDGDIPVVISPQCACDAFDELAASDLLNSVALEKIWTTLSRGGRSRVITSYVPPAAFRHFRLAAGFFWAEWLCAEVEFDLAEQPEPPDPPPVKADRNPFG
jgi:hypothetical protein